MVDAEIATSIQVNDGSWIKPGIRIANIIVTGDPETDAAQIEEAANTGVLAHAKINELLGVLVSEVLADMPSIRSVLEALEKAVAVNTENVQRTAVEVKRQRDALKAAGIDKGK